jgi:microcystin-dependent protein
MTEVFVGQIVMTGFGFAPKGFALCNGQLLPVNQNQALFALIGTYYGGNGTSNFQLPNLQGRTPAGYGPSVDPIWQPSPYALGQSAGTEAVTLLSSQMPMHNHLVNANTTPGSVKAIANAGFGASTNSAIPTYAAPGSGATPLYPATIGMQGGNVPHQNMQPFRVISFSIAQSGSYPARN